MSAVPLFDPLRRLFNRACDEFGLVQDGDRIMIGLSGGKDSLTLVTFLSLLRDVKQNFHIIAAHIKFTNLPYAIEPQYLEDFCAERNVEYHLIEDQIREGHLENDHASTCIHCSRFRRAKLMELARIHNCNKLALGHHLDDVVATLLMNMTQHGRFAGMAVKLNITVGELHYPLTLIRPLCLIQEDDIIKFVEQAGYQPAKCRCPWGDTGFRSKTRQVTDLLGTIGPETKMNLFQSQFKATQKSLGVIKNSDIEDLDVSNGLSCGGNCVE